MTNRKLVLPVIDSESWFQVYFGAANWKVPLVFLPLLFLKFKSPHLLPDLLRGTETACVCVGGAQALGMETGSSSTSWLCYLLGSAESSEDIAPDSVGCP